MALIIFGILVILVSVFSASPGSPIRKFRPVLMIGGIIIVAIGIGTSAIRQIPAGHVGVQILFGEVKPGFLPEGLRLVNPLVDIEEFSVRTQNYTMSSANEEGVRAGDDAIVVLSEDGLEVRIDLTILYRVSPSIAPVIFRNIGLDYENVIIRPVTRTGIRNSAAQFIAVEIFAEKRVEFEDAIRKTIQDTLTNRGFILDQILIRKIDLPKSVKESIEKKITAIQDAQRMEFVLQKEEREAERKRVEARGIADYQRTINEGLSPKILQFEQIKVQKELVNSPNSKIILLGSEKSPPFIIGN